MQKIDIFQIDAEPDQTNLPTSISLINNQPKSFPSSQLT